MKRVLYPLIFLLGFSFFSAEVFSQASPITAAPPAAGYPRHETDAQNQIQLTLNSSVATFSCSGAGCSAWTVTVGGAPVTINSVTVSGTIVLINFTPAVGIGQAVTVSYTGGSGINPFGPINSFNDRVIACSDFTFQALIENTPPCAPVKPINKMVFAVNRGARNSARWAGTTKQVRTHWITDGAAPFSDMNAFESTSAGVAQANTYFVTVDAAPDPYQYPTNDAVCGYSSVWKIRIGATVCPVSSANQTVVYASHNTDAQGEGTGQINLPPTVAGTNLVCFGDNVNMTFSDATQLNCNAPAPAPPIPANDEVRWVRVRYGWRDNGGVGNIPNVIVGGGAGVPVTDGTGTRLYADGYFPVAPVATTFGNPDAFGVVQVNRPVNGPRGILELIRTTSTVGQVVNQRLWVRIEYWNICNPYTTGDFSNVRWVENFVEIIDKPLPPTVPNRDICSGDNRQLSVNPTLGGHTYRWYATLAHAQAAATGGPTVLTTGANFTPSNAQAPAGTSTNFYVVAFLGSGCKSDPTMVTLKRRSALSSAGLSIQGPANLCPESSYSFQVNVPPAAGAPAGEPTRYRWQIPAGWTIAPASGIGQVVTITTGAGTGVGTITVNYEYTNLTSNNTRCEVTFTAAPTVRARPTASITPDPIDICQGTVVQLDGNPVLPPAAGGFNPTISSHTWGGSVAILDATNVQQPNIIAAAPSGAHNVTYVVTANFGGGVSCASNPVNRNVNITPNPGVADAGLDQAWCGTLSTTLLGNTPAAGSGTWTYVSSIPNGLPAPAFSDVNDENSTLTIVGGNEGAYTLEWKIVNGLCESSDLVVIDFGSDPTDPVAGPPQDICGESTALAGNVITIGAGTWTVVSGPGACVGAGCQILIADPSLNTSGLSLIGPGFVYGTYTLRWTSVSGTCPTEFSEVDITFNQPPTISGPVDFTACADNPPTLTIPVTGTFGGGASNARWETVIGSGAFQSSGASNGNFLVNPVSDVYVPSAGDFGSGSVQLRLITNDPGGACAAVSTLVNVTLDRLPSIVFAGADNATCDPSINLNGSVVNNGGSGSWSVGEVLYYESFPAVDNGLGIIGPSGAATFNHPGGNWSVTVPGASLIDATDWIRVQNASMEARDVTNEVLWRSSSVNISAFANISVSLQLSEYGPMEPDDYIRAFYSIDGGGEVLIGQIEGNNVVEGNGGFRTVNLSGLSGNSIELIVRIKNDDDDEYHRFDNVLVSGASATVPTISSLNDPVSGVTDLPVGTTSFIWTVSSNLGFCSSAIDDVEITRHPLPVANGVIPNNLCEDAVGVDIASGVNLTQYDNAISGGCGTCTVEWFYGPGATNPVPTPNSEDVSDGGIYFVQVTETSLTPNCQNIGALTFVVNSLPVAINLFPEFCEETLGSDIKNNIDLTTFDDAARNGVGANTVTWFDNSMVPVPDPLNVSANNGTTFISRILDVNGCESDASLSVAVNPIPGPNPISGATQVCVDPNAVNLFQVTNIVSGTTYTWNVPEPPFVRFGGGGPNDFFLLLAFPTVTSPGLDISVVETSAKGCTGAPNVLNILVDDKPPVLAIVGPAAVCENEAGVNYTVNPILGGGTTYAWTVPPGASVISGQGTPNVVINFGMLAGDIEMVPTTLTGCAGNPADLPITINARPSLNVLSNSVCSDDIANITLAGPGAATFNITNVLVPPGLAPPARALINGALADEIENDVFTNLTGGNLTVQYTVVPVSAQSCTGTPQLVNLVVRPEPTLAAGLVDVICSTTEPVSVVLSVAAGSVAAASFNVAITNNGLTQLAGIEVGPGPFGPAVLVGDTWRNLTGAPVDVLYTISPISASGCIGDPPVDVIVTVNPEPTINPILPDPDEICSDNTPTVTFTADIPSSFNWLPTSITGIITGAAAGSGATVSNILTNAGLAQGSVTYQVTPVSALSCAGVSGSFDVLINPLPGANNRNLIVCSDAVAGNTYVTDLTTLESSVNNGAVTFAWFQNPGLTIPIGTPTSYAVTNNIPVYVEVDDGLCTNVATVLYRVDPTPSVTSSITSNFNGFQISCTGASDGQLTAVPANGTFPYQFSIDGGATLFNTPIFNGLSVLGGPYTVRVRDANGCTNDAAPLTFVNPPPVSGGVDVKTPHNGQNVSCQNASDGSVEILPAGGAGGGVPANYTYRILELPGNTTGNATGLYTGLRAGQYTMVITDANTCQFTLPPVTLTEPTAVQAAAVLTAPVSCNGQSDGVITVTGSGGTLINPNYTFTLNQPPGTVNNTGVFSSLPAGSYTVTARDDNNCAGVSGTVVVIQPSTLSAFVSITSNYNGAKISCPGANDGEVTGVANGGNGGFTFTLIINGVDDISNGTGVFPSLGPATYSIRAEDIGGCDITSATVSITEPLPVVGAGAVTGAISCNAGSDGQITITATGGTGTYTFTQVPGPSNPSGIFNGLADGVYDFIVNDLNSCQDDVQVTIIEPTQVVASSSVTSNYNGSQVSCNGSSDGIITITASGGTGLLQYVFDQFQFTNTTGQFSGVFTGVPATTGNTFTVRDSKNCIVVTTPVDVTQPLAVTASGAVPNPYNGQQITCVGANDGFINITAAGGTGVLTYRIDQLPTNLTGAADGQFSGIGAGVYTSTVRDVNNCFIISAPITITPPPALTATLAVTSIYNGGRQITCNGASDGVLTTTPGGGVPAYAFSLIEMPGNLSGSGSGIFTGVPAGIYTVQVTDLNNCVRVTSPITINEPPVLIGNSVVTSNYNGQQISCVGSSDGTIRITQTGGTPLYTYEFVEIPGNTSGQATGIFTGIPAGDFTFIVRDVNNCEFTTALITITPPTPIIGSAAVTSSYNGSQISCNGASDAIVSITAGGGTGVLQYAFDQIPANTTGLFSGAFIGVPAGNGYSFTVRDANNCLVGTNTVDVTEPGAVIASGSVTSDYNGEDVRCFGSTDGEIQIVASGGTGAFTYRLDQAPLNTTGNATGLYSGVGAGSFTSTVRDVNNCFVVTTPIVVTQPTIITASMIVSSNYNGRQISCNGVSDGALTVAAIGGVPTYSYLLTQIPANTTGDVSGVFTGIPAGGYTVMVTDLNGCERTTSLVNITQPDVLVASAVVTSNYNGENVSCNGASDGIIRVTPTGGTAVYSYSFIEIPGNNTGLNSGIFNGIPAGASYSFQVTDVNLCTTTTLPIQVTEPTPIVASAIVSSNYNGQDISCNGVADGIITISSSGGTGIPVNVFDQFPASNQTGRFSGIFTSVPAGNGYTFTITDVNGCPTVTAPIDVVQPDAITGTGVATSNFNGFNVSCFNASDGEVTITSGGGTAPLAYLLLENPGNGSGVSSGVFNNLRAGTYRVRIADVNGCLFTTTPTAIVQPADLIITINKTSNYNGFDLSCNGTNDGEVSVITSSGGAGGYSYELFRDGSTTGNVSGQASGIFSGLISGLYDINIRDINNCVKKSLPVILIDPLPLFEGILGFDQGICFNQDDPDPIAEIAPAFGSIGNYTYQWQQSTDNTNFSDMGGATSVSFDPPSNLAIKTFYRRVITSGCETLTSNSVSVTINSIPTATLTPSRSPVCEGEFFILEFDFDNGQAPYYFDYNNGTTFINDRIGADLTPVPVLNYSETTTFTLTELRDFNGCFATVLPPPVTVPVSKINPNFTITSPNAQCSGGTFTFQWTVDTNIDYTWTWSDGATDFIPANSRPNGVNTISHDFESFNTSGNTNFPVILSAINNVDGCGPKQANQPITIFPNIVINIFPNKNEMCSGEQVSIVNPTQGGATHTWTVIRQSDGQVVENRNFTTATDQFFTINNNLAGAVNPDVYNIVYDVANANCSAQEVIPVIVYQNIAASFSISSFDVYTGSPVPVTFTNTSNPVDPANFTYDWEFGVASVPDLQSGVGPFTVDYTAPGFKTIRLTSVNIVAQSNGVNCRSIVEQTILIEVPPFAANFDYIPDAACFPTRIQITRNFAVSGANPNWRVVDQGGRLVGTANVDNPVFDIINPGEYTIFLEVLNPITGQIAFADNSGTGPNAIPGKTPVKVYPKPQATFQARPTTLFVPNTELVTFNFSQPTSVPSDEVSFLWNFGDTNDVVKKLFGETDPTYFYVVEGRYKITMVMQEIRDTVTCIDSAQVEIIAREGGQIKIPNAFTPDPSGPNGGYASSGSVNDVFLPLVQGINLDEPNAFVMQIYDRWGTLIFESRNTNKNEPLRGWDGYDRNGNLLPAGVYVYKLVLRLVDGQRTTQIGDVTLLR